MLSLCYNLCNMHILLSLWIPYVCIPNATKKAYSFTLCCTILLNRHIWVQLAMNRQLSRYVLVLSIHLWLRLFPLISLDDQHLTHAFHADEGTLVECFPSTFALMKPSSSLFLLDRTESLSSFRNSLVFFREIHNSPEAYGNCKVKTPVLPLTNRLCEPKNSCSSF